jgi:hypothetical protein
MINVQQVLDLYFYTAVPSRCLAVIRHIFALYQPVPPLSNLQPPSCKKELRRILNMIIRKRRNSIITMIIPLLHSYLHSLRTPRFFRRLQKVLRQKLSLRVEIIRSTYIN